MTDVRAIAAHLAGPARAAARSFALTLIGVVTLGSALAAALAVWFRGDPVMATAAAGMTVIVSLAAGLLLAGKRAVAGGLAAGTREWGLGSKTVALVFDRLGVPAGGDGNSGNPACLISSADAAGRLSRAAADVSGSLTGARGWAAGLLWRRLRSTIVGRIAAKCSAATSGDGVVDLRRVRADVEPSIDRYIADRLTRGAAVWTMIVLAGLPLFALALAVCLSLLQRSY